MDFRRNQFRFKTNNPLDRQAELMRRFGIDNSNTNQDSTTMNGCKVPAPPRFQFKDSHEVNLSSPMKQKNEPMIENDNKDYQSDSGVSTTKTLKMQNGTQTHSSILNSILPTINKMSHTSRVRNVPIIVEKDDHLEPKKLVDLSKKELQNKTSKPKKPNGPFLIKQEKPDSKVFQQIAAVMQEFRMFKEYAEKFNGKEEDKEYSYLDEMLLQCILKLDNIEVGGNSDARLARKSAIKEVQNCIDELEIRICQTSKGIIQDPAPETKDIADNDGDVENNQELVDIVPNSDETNFNQGLQIDTTVKVELLKDGTFSNLQHSVPETLHIDSVLVDKISNVVHNSNVSQET